MPASATRVARPGAPACSRRGRAAERVVERARVEHRGQDPADDVVSRAGGTWPEVNIAAVERPGRPSAGTSVPASAAASGSRTAKTKSGPDEAVEPRGLQVVQQGGVLTRLHAVDAVVGAHDGVGAALADRALNGGT